VTFVLSQSATVLLLICLGSTLLVSGLAVVFIERLHGETRERAAITAAAYMTALGSLFAILTGFLINSEYSTYRETQRIVGTEVAAASQLAYASADLPPADAGRVQNLLEEYMRTLVTSEWPALRRGDPAGSGSFTALGNLQRAVFRIAERPYVAVPVADSMQTSVTTMTESRRERVVIASQSLPFALFVLSIIAGLALIVNAIIASLRAGPVYAVIALGIVILVGLDLAAILAISAPFRGPFTASTQPIEQIVTELGSGRYLPWIVQ
jgi:hypothetical protein